MSILSQSIPTQPRPFTRIALLSCAAVLSTALTACASNGSAEVKAKSNPNATAIEILAPEPVLSPDDVLEEENAAAQSPGGGT